MYKVTENCVACLYDKQAHSVRNMENQDKANAYLEEIKRILEERNEDDCAPYLVSLFRNKYKEFFGDETTDFALKKRSYNDLVIDMLEAFVEKIEGAVDPLSYSLFQARIGNYIDFGAMNEVDEETFLGLFDEMEISSQDEDTYSRFVTDCEKAKSFLLLADNCGEIVLDLLFLEQLRARFRDMDIYVMVRGEEVLNDVTIEDAMYVGVHNVAMLIDNGNAVAGTVYELCSDQAKALIDSVDVILSKGQGNYESFAGKGRHAYYSFLCKCDLFTERFNVPRLTGMFISE